MSRSVSRATLFSLVGVGFLLHWIRQESGWRPRLPSSEPEVVVAFTALLLAHGLALWQFGAIVPDRRVRRAASALGVAAAVCAVANVLEDGYGVESAFFLFIAATLVLLLGQFLLAVVVLRTTGSWLLASTPGLSGLALALYPPLGGPLMLCAWGLAAVSVCRRTAPPGPRPSPSPTKSGTRSWAVENAARTTPAHR